MLKFTKHMNRIEYLTAQTLVHVQEENYQKAKQNLYNIHVHTSAVLQQLNNFEFAKAQCNIDTDADLP